MTGALTLLLTLINPSSINPKADMGKMRWHNINLLTLVFFSGALLYAYSEAMIHKADIHRTIMFWCYYILHNASLLLCSPIHLPEEPSLRPNMID